MDNEELEQIPWSALVADVEDSSDRRWYLVAGAITVLVVGYIVIQFLLPGGQPAASSTSLPGVEAEASCIRNPEQCEGEPGAAEVGPEVVVTEADLRAPGQMVATDPDLRMAIARAEWFTTDWHTSDGSDETKAAVDDALVPGVELDHQAGDGANQTYVEWARATSAATTKSGIVVTVAYRTIATSDGVTYVRQPVRASSVDVVFVDGVPLVRAEPTAVMDPWAGTR